MFTRTLEPGFYDTDALGHINNTRLPVWFEHARNDVFYLFSGSWTPRDWNLITAHIEVDFKAQIYFGQLVEIRTGIEKIGNTSFSVLQDLYQNGTWCARGKTTLVHFNWNTNKPAPLTAEQRQRLASQLLSGS